MSYALKPSIGPINRPPPWRRSGFHSFQGVGSYTESPGFHYEYATAGLGAITDPVVSSTGDLQRKLIERGFSVGSTGADGVWGRNSQSGLNSALGRTVEVAVAGRPPNQTVTLSRADALALSALPERRSSGTTSGGSSSTSSGGSSSTSSGGGTTIGPNTIPGGDPENLLGGGGIQWAQIWPWAVGAGAFLVLGGTFLYMGRRKRGGASATPAVVTANRRRRRSRRSRR